MDTPMSFPVWLLLVATIAIPVRFSLKRLGLQGRIYHFTLSVATMTLAMFTSFMALHWNDASNLPRLALLSCLLGAAFGLPIGLIVAAIAAPAAKAKIKRRAILPPWARLHLPAGFF